MLGKVLTIQSFPPTILNCNVFIQNRIQRTFRHECYDNVEVIYTHCRQMYDVYTNFLQNEYCRLNVCLKGSIHVIVMDMRLYQTHIEVPL